MKMSIIKKVILTVAAAALFVVPVTIIALQSNPTKTADASYYSGNSNQCAKTDFAKLGSYCPVTNPCNSTCYHTAANNCSVMYYSYITSSYSSCTPVKNPTTNPSANTVSTSYVNTNYIDYSYPSYDTTPSYNSCSTNYTVYGCSDMNNYNSGSNYSYSTDYSYYNPGSYQSYIAEPYYNIPVPEPKQNYIDIYVPEPKYSYPTPSQNIASTLPEYSYYDYYSTDYFFSN